MALALSMRTTLQSTTQAIREVLSERQGRMVLVPTMGALHDGHLALVREARTLAGETGCVVVSVFVNPTQFGPEEDFAAYPRELESDLAKCEAAGADFVFAPDPAEMYYPDASVDVRETSLSRHLCGASRPGHFEGVCLVVLKLFHIVSPDVGVFGKKDRQQLAVIKRMVRDLNLDIEIHGVETVRETDGLAMSSRNAYLSTGERAQAPAIRRALLTAAELVAGGERESDILLTAARGILQRDAPLGREDYLEVVDAGSMQRVSSITEPAIMAAAMFFGQCRLIDNVELNP